MYAPNTADPETKVDNFYDKLQEEVSKIQKSDKQIIIGDLNAKVGDDHSKWNGVLGQHGYGNMNDRGEKLVKFCAANNLCISNTLQAE